MQQQFTVQATLTKTYEMYISAENADDAITSLDEWIADDFEDFEVGARWDFVAI